MCFETNYYPCLMLPFLCCIADASKGASKRYPPQEASEMHLLLCASCALCSGMLQMRVKLSFARTYCTRTTPTNKDAITQQEPPFHQPCDFSSGREMKQWPSGATHSISTAKDSPTLSKRRPTRFRRRSDLPEQPPTQSVSGSKLILPAHALKEYLG